MDQTPSPALDVYMYCITSAGKGEGNAVHPVLAGDPGRERSGPRDYARACLSSRARHVKHHASLKL